MNKKSVIIFTVIISVVLIGWFVGSKFVFENQTNTDTYPLPILTEELTVKIGETKIGNTEVSLAPLQIIEDSRCPANANCIWAGRLIVKVRVSESDTSQEIDFTQGERIDTDFGEITLTDALPLRSTGDSPKPEDYQFTFDIKR